MRTFSLLSLFLSLAASFAVFGYLPEWRFEGFNYKWMAHSSALSHLIFFSLEPNVDGSILHENDRFPSNTILLDARSAFQEAGKKLMVCFGGNGRSQHFPVVTRDEAKRARFVQAAVDLVRRKRLHGIDINWEYPGFRFGQGYLSNDEIVADYAGLEHLMRDLRQSLPNDAVLSLAYYPDGRQEVLLRPIARWVDFMHSMAYDANGPEHSSFDLAERTIAQFKSSGIPSSKLTLGLPFYGRSPQEWRSYEDLVQKPDAAFNFNSIGMIERKTRLALDNAAGGLMIWEIGQDCRVQAVTRNDKTHVVTCPRGEEDSLIVAIGRQINAAASREEL